MPDLDYIRINWRNYSALSSSVNTPLNADNLNIMDEGIDNIYKYLNSLNTAQIKASENAVFLGASLDDILEEIHSQINEKHEVMQWTWLDKENFGAFAGSATRVNNELICHISFDVTKELIGMQEPIPIAEIPGVSSIDRIIPIVGINPTTGDSRVDYLQLSRGSNQIVWVVHPQHPLPSTNGMYYDIDFCVNLSTYNQS